MEVSICEDKYERVCRDIDEFMAGVISRENDDGTTTALFHDAKELERLRGRIISWMIVVPHLGKHQVRFLEVYS